ncbi:MULTISPECIES: glycosyltransferase family A protein [unclassified Moorena]|uniref:glycosyltransferase family A protein n=1 Tax=unclassified Moorena TaxID=2683338 RepID=UPI0013CAC631|nr:MULTISPECIES: glycosyltransferase family A protein [unclassified Moorena]NEO20625.1 glycosyltransferase family 2 protein [Moorena sp. SIO4A5]NEO48209.1 glycosyltransferase family 2 protein [Moorena sp. SIO4A3]NEQ58598.1 glycosyltransferase family 2 protein [Moorena sp. SIO4A1]
MLVFVIPLKSRNVSKSWEHVSKLFERCIKSVCNQTSSEFRVIVVCNEKPEITFSHPHIIYLEVDYPTPKEKNPIAIGLTDKGRKVLTGLTYARRFDPTHAMNVDADDCVSKQLAEFVRQNPQGNGWFINRGYKYRDGEDCLYLKRKQFYRMSGTANIIRWDLLELPEKPEYNRGYGYYKFYIDHEKVKNILANKGTPLKPLPFSGSVYILGTGENISANEDRLSFNIFNRKALSKSICDEFGLYKLA